VNTRSFYDGTKGTLQGTLILYFPYIVARRMLTSLSYFKSYNVFTILVYARTLHTSIIRNISIGNVSEKTISSIKKNIEKARSHLNDHVTEEGRVINLDKKCEYCQIYMRE
jgi:hypothetical protein